MKTNSITKTVLTFFIMFSFSYSSYAQYQKVVIGKEARCAKKNFCKSKDMGDYDYRSQTHSALLSPGDTARLKIVVYSRQKYRLLVCGDDDLVGIRFNVYDLFRKTKRTYKTKKTGEKDVYKLDEYGEEVLDDDDDPIIIRTEPVYDTIWTTKSFYEKKLLFDSEKDAVEGKRYWEKSIAKTKRLLVEVIVPPEGGDPEEVEGCVSMMIGRKSGTLKEFSKFY